MQYFHFTETNGRDKREEAFSAKDENELAWFLNEVDIKGEDRASALRLFNVSEGGRVVAMREGRFISLEVVSRRAYERVKARKLRNALAGL